MASTPQGLWNRPLEQWKVTELKDELRRRKMPIKGLKDDLIKRLEEVFRAEDDTINQDHDMREDHQSVPDIHIPAPEMKEEHNVEEVKEEKNVEQVMEEQQRGEEVIGDEEMTAEQNVEGNKEDQNVEEVKGDEEMKEDQNVEEVKGDEEMKEGQNIQQVKEIKEEGNVENMKEIKGEGNDEDKKEINQEENSETKMDEKASSTLAGEKPNPCPNNQDAEGVYVTMVDDNEKMEKDGSIPATDTEFERKNGSVSAAENNPQESCGNDVNLGSKANETNQNSILQWEQHITTTDEVLHDHSTHKERADEVLHDHSALKERVSDLDHSKNEEEPTNACFDMDQSKPANACDSVDQLKRAEEAPVVGEPLRQGGTSGIVSQENQKAGDENNAEAIGDKRKQEDEDVVEPIKRQRRWNAGSQNVPKPLMQDDPSAMTATSLVSPVQSPISLQRPVSSKRSIARSDPPTSVEATNQKERVVPSSQRPPTSSLRIDKFLRPFTIKAVHELLGKTGTITNFWMDHIKTHCYVTFSSVDEAIATRKAVYNLQWPPNGGRLLVAEFVEPEEVKRKEDGDQQGVPTAPQSNSSQQAGNFQTKSHQIQGGPGPTQQPFPLPVNVKLPPPPPIAPPARERQQKAPKNVEQPTVTLDDLFRKTKSTPRIYYLPLSEEEVAVKVAKITEEMVD